MSDRMTSRWGNCHTLLESQVCAPETRRTEHSSSCCRHWDMSLELSPVTHVHPHWETLLPLVQAPIDF